MSESLNSTVLINFKRRTTSRV